MPKRETVPVLLPILCLLCIHAFSAETIPRLANPQSTPLRNLPKSAPWYRKGMPVYHETFEPAFTGFIRDRTLDYYRSHGVSDPRWDAAAEKLLVMKEVHFPGVLTPELSAAADAVLATGCEDPVAMLYAHLVKSRERLEPEDKKNNDAIVRKLVEEIMSGPANSLIKFRAARSGVTLAGGNSEQYYHFLQAMHNAFIALLEDQLLPERYANEIAYELWLRNWQSPRHGGHDPADGIGQRLEELLEQNKRLREKYAGLLGMLTGTRLREKGWAARGYGTIDTVTPEGWEEFGKYVALANPILRDAYRACPQFPHICTEMIQQARDYGGEKDSVDEWFRRGVWARFDHMDLYRDKLFAMRPRWGGSHRMMTAFAWECLYTERFDTWVPNVFITTIHSIAEETGAMWRSLYREEHLTAALRECYEGYLAEERFADVRQHFLANYAYTLLLCGDYEDALRHYEELPEKKPGEWEYPADFQCGIYAAQIAQIPVAAGLFLGEHGEALREAEAAQMEGDLIKAAELFGQVCEKVRSDAPAAAYLRHRLGECLLWSGRDEGTIDNSVAFRRLHTDIFAHDAVAREAATINRPDIIAKLLSLGAEKKAATLSMAIDNNSYETAKILLEDGETPLVNEGYSALHYAAVITDMKMFELVAQYDRNVNGKASDGLTPLHRAALNGKSAEIAAALVRHGADVNALDNKGKTPLHHACRYGRAEFADVLLEAGADPNIADADGIVPAYWSMWPDRLATLRNLARHGADMNADYKGALLAHAGSRGDVKTTETLLELGADPNRLSSNGTYPIMDAISSDKPEILDLLLQNGASPDVVTKTGHTVLDYALRNKSEACLARILESSPDVNRPGPGLGSYLHTAVASGRMDVLQRVLAMNPDLEIGNPRGYTPLLLAANYGRSEMADALLERGANALAQDKQGNYASKIAHSSGYPELGENLSGKETRALVRRHAPIALAAAVILAAVIIAVLRSRKSRRAKPAD